MPLIKCKRQRPCIALIADEFTTISLQPDADLVLLTPTNWHWKLRLFKPDMLLVESCWRGFKNSWHYKIASYPDKRTSEHFLGNLIEYCQQRRIPTVFWNKEDPVHFHRFINTAMMFDFVYTTDSLLIQRYKNKLTAVTRHIDSLLFSAQPELYQPIDAGIGQGIAFFGGYYGDEFPERSRQQYAVLQAIKQQELTIFDRFWHKETGCSFPAGLQVHCRPAVPAKEVAKYSQQFSLQLNFNTVQHSPTMMSRRLFELGCMGCCVISTPSVGMSTIFGDSIAQFTDISLAAEQSLALQNDTIKRKRMGKTIREITLSAHTWRHRLMQIQGDISRLY